MVRILLADDNISLRSALALLLETRLDAQVIGQVNSVESLFSEAGSTQPDFIIIDWELPGRYRISSHVIETLRRLSPKSCLIVSSANPDAACSAMDACADGFINKADTPDDLLKTIQRRIQNG